MNTRMLFAVVLAVLLAHFSAQAQTTPRAAATSAGKSTNAQSNDRSPKNSNSMNRATVDGSDGSATNDGASGQSGSPAPLPVIATDKKTIKSSRKVKNSSSKLNRMSTTPGKKSTDG